jgi:hypothetical protein
MGGFLRIRRMTTRRLGRRGIVPATGQAAAPPWREDKQKAAGDGDELEKQRIHGNTLYAYEAKNVGKISKGRVASIPGFPIIL